VHPCLEVECSSVAQAAEAIEAGADIVMLDNKTPAELASATAEVRVSPETNVSDHD
jgi:nicotinate-nucleotide pyrophosphorylase